MKGSGTRSSEQGSEGGCRFVKNTTACKRNNLPFLVASVQV